MQSDAACEQQDVAGDAYRWRGNRRGLRITSWLDRSKLPTGVTIGSPVEYHSQFEKRK